MRPLETLKAFILNTLFPPVCVSCKKEGDFLCENCLKSLDKKKIRPIYHKTEKDPDFHYIDDPDIEEGINAFAETHGIELLITIPKKHKLLDKIFQRSHTRELAMHAHVPILAIHE